MSTINKKLAIYILSYNRPEYIIGAIDSIISQNYASYEIIVSENSPNDSVLKLLQNKPEYQNLTIIKRTPSLPSLEHFNTILMEAKKYEYVMLFHDDDILMPNAISKMMHTLEATIELAAVGCNAYVIKDTVHTKKVFAPQITQNISITSQSQLIKRYLFRHLSHVPFPSYIYRTSKLKNCFLDPKDGGKHSDTSYLIKLVKAGSITWLAEPLMKYRMHASNDSAVVSIKDVYSICKFYVKTSPELTIYASIYFFKSVSKRLRQILKNLF